MRAFRYFLGHAHPSYALLFADDSLLMAVGPSWRTTLFLAFLMLEN